MDHMSRFNFVKNLGLFKFYLHCLIFVGSNPFQELGFNLEINKNESL